MSILACFDFGYTFISTSESILKLADGDKVVHMASCLGEKKAANIVWLTLFPYLLWPLSNIFMTASMYMTVAISIDRYIVVCYPFYACEREHTNLNNAKWPQR